MTAMVERERQTSFKERPRWPRGRGILDKTGHFGYKRGNNQGREERRTLVRKAQFNTQVSRDKVGRRVLQGRYSETNSNTERTHERR